MKPIEFTSPKYKHRAKPKPKPKSKDDGISILKDTEPNEEDVYEYKDT